MGRIAIQDLLPGDLSDSDGACPVGSWGLPRTASVMRSGFARTPGEPVKFEGETPVTVRLCERTWTWDAKVSSGRRMPRKTRRFRLEIGVEAQQKPIEPKHTVTVAQLPYSAEWVQRGTFKRYSQKGPQDRTANPEPASDMDPVEWLEIHIEYDPWEKGKRYTAGISSGTGLAPERLRNAAGDFIFGACPDGRKLEDELISSDPKILRLQEDTGKNRIVFWHPKASDAGFSRRLHDEVIAEGNALLLSSIRQAMAGPRSAPEKWVGRPVADLVSIIYRDHLNRRNRSVMPKGGRERTTKSTEARITPFLKSNL